MSRVICDGLEICIPEVVKQLIDNGSTICTPEKAREILSVEDEVNVIMNRIETFKIGEFYRFDCDNYSMHLYIIKVNKYKNKNYKIMMTQVSGNILFTEKISYDKIRKTLIDGITDGTIIMHYFK